MKFLKVTDNSFGTIRYYYQDKIVSLNRCKPENCIYPSEYLDIETLDGRTNRIDLKKCTVEEVEELNILKDKLPKTE